MKTKNLTQLSVGESGMVAGIQGGHGLTCRLESMGIRAGKKVTKVSTQFMRGPITVKVDQGQVAMGYGMAKKILMETENE